MADIQYIDDIVYLAQSGFQDWESFGAVTVKEEDDYLLFNYKPEAQYEGIWTPFEQLSRGLIIDKAEGKVVANPFEKFFNWGERGHTTDAPIRYVMEKMDGSLGICWYDSKHSQWRVTTRGSFSSEQGEWATTWLHAGKPKFIEGADKECTYLFEIIYPANRIVVDYGDYKGLVLLAAKNNERNHYLSRETLERHAREFGLDIAKMYSFRNPQDILDLLPLLDSNQEGFVAVFEDNCRFKFKGNEYVELHRIISAISFKNTLLAIANGTINEVIEAIPDEFMPQVRHWITVIETQVRMIKNKANLLHMRAKGDAKGDRKLYAQYVLGTDKNIAPYCFALLDGKDIEPIIYKKFDWSVLQVQGQKTMSIFCISYRPKGFKSQFGSKWLDAVYVFAETEVKAIAEFLSTTECEFEDGIEIECRKVIL